ncbi:hypothetical protein [Rhizobium metallidurans]|uniref:Uncharacterized protein n=1 Tax=Rhizobium metallidurans TaxID=1265931 RepID=A0A7W6CLJ1_9HYPH|nr:hypothetical protein [Rhizobium metallidurans]MBB3962506.1 hypothetical protein [Rhizobium metallidurans]
MTSIIIVLCIALCAFSVMRYLAARTRLAEKKIDEAIARKLRASPILTEMQEIREMNAVMRNLLIDMVENEASASPLDIRADDKERAYKLRHQRRREIFGEAVFLLQHTEGAQAQNSQKTAS